jgi:hypothetical protein
MIHIITRIYAGVRPYVGFAILSSKLNNGLSEIVLPLWLATLLFAMAPAAYVLKMTGRRRRARAGFCPSCGYDLRASKELCPECGTSIMTQTETTG